MTVPTRSSLRAQAPPRGPRRRGWLLAVVIAALAGATLLALVASGIGLPGREEQASPALNTGGTQALAADSDLTATFLDTYVQDDGRVSRLDQGGDTVSEGQAYAMLLATAAGDEDTFAKVWAWTETNLLRDDGLLSWTWADGQVTDPTSASDADLDAAHALVAAGERFGRPDWTEAGTTLGEAVLEEETVMTSLGRVLTAGSWANSEPWQVNPSYSSPLAVSYLSAVSDDPRWAELAQGDRALVRALLEISPLPPDWAQVDRDGSVAAMPAPDSAGDTAGQVRFGLDAARVSIRFATSCDPADRQVAAGLSDVLDRPAGEIRGIYDLGGAATVDWRHPLQVVSAAAATQAYSGAETGSSPELLRAAGELARQQPTYYGIAWAALGDVLLSGESDLVPAGCQEAS